MVEKKFHCRRFCQPVRLLIDGWHQHGLQRQLEDGAADINGRRRLELQRDVVGVVNKHVDALDAGHLGLDAAAVGRSFPSNARNSVGRDPGRPELGDLRSDADFPAANSGKR